MLKTPWLIVLIALAAFAALLTAYQLIFVTAL
jgi:hypothetical protein